MEIGGLRSLTLLWADLAYTPLWPTNGAEEHGIGGLACLDGVGGQRLTSRVDGCASKVFLRAGE